VLGHLLSVFQQYPDLAAVTLFGSYATAKATPRSDIDLATVGLTDRYRLGRLALDLEDLPIPQKCDVQAYENINYEPLKRHIDERGVTIYEKASPVETP
jgi:predicted nucleotidyltransferase